MSSHDFWLAFRRGEEIVCLKNRSIPVRVKTGLFLSALLHCLEQDQSEILPGKSLHDVLVTQLGVLAMHRWRFVKSV